MGSEITKIYDAIFQPAYDLGQDLGSASYRWKDLYLGGTAYLLAVSINGDISVTARNFVFDTSTGVKIGTSASQKLAFFNASPIVQPSGTGETTGFTAGTGTAVLDDSTFTGNVGSTAYRINDIVKALKQLGLLAQ